MWAESLGHPAASQLLADTGLTERVVNYAAQTGGFDFALRCAEAAKRGDLVMSVHQHHGRALEQQGAPSVLVGEWACVACYHVARAMRATCMQGALKRALVSLNTPC